MCIVQRNISSITNLVTRCQLMMADPSLGAARDLARETIDLQVPGGYKFMVKPIIYIDSEIPVV